MKSTLKSLWQNCFFEECSKIEDTESKNLLHDIVNCQDAIYKDLTPNQIRQMENLIEQLHAFNALYLEKAFEKGVIFATSYLLDIIY